VLKDVEHGDGRATLRGEGGPRQRGADCRHSVHAPGEHGGIEREIQPDDRKTVIGEHAQKETSAATDIENRALLLRIFHRAEDEAGMIAEDEAAIRLFEAVDSRIIRCEPVILGVVLQKLLGGRTRMKADQTATRALDDVKLLSGGLVEPVRCGEQAQELPALAGGAFVVGAFQLGSPQADSSVSLRSSIR
jgi:hypothetical protein